ncbi:DNA-directed RNA polymerase subunit beta' [Mycoplasma iguanae]|uniref:DNA-directed RNA polymerase subunit beta' n=1 Tax=Mycoplasma iguanae TaxID=292461 RepID=A0ABY5R8T7_9MOLU|nr:DNA-directed RNA polymerase subunit beta' [Mycoplasma iguanae]UVD81921.1 DNA-directed RNA polymerase subunit beta' [Mycoplasma iguanae]
MKITRKYSYIDENKISKISLALATSENIKTWSHGEVTKPETVNYKSYKPEKDGLFDELIFGPTIDHKCPVCGKKYKKSNEGILCTATAQCEALKPEILPKISRRSRMGHIKLNAPVVHFWYFKIDHSILAKLLGLKVEGTSQVITRTAIESLIYYKSHIVLESGGLKSLPKNKIIEISDAAVIYFEALKEIQQNYEPGSEDYEELKEALNDLDERARSKMGKDYGVDFYELNEIIEEYSDARINTGSKAIEYLLENIDLEKEQQNVKEQINKINALDNTEEKVTNSKRQERDKLYKRLQVINSFINSGQDPKSMLITYLPVIPADLRPLIQLDGGRHSTSDINELYRRIIIRNNRLKKWQEQEAPMLIIQNELRMIQEAVDALIDNQRKTPSPIASKDNRPLKSISDALVGKKGRFRQNLLGKRVDYSGRSVIVVGPELKMYQVGIPREMAAKLFEPWIIRRLLEKEIAPSIKSAKKMIEELDNKIWPHVADVIQGRPVLLNRAPTLHRLSIQAFEPVLVRGKAIKLHPLVTTAFNADFDGDQMAVHVPVSDEAVREARELMFANKNILGPKDGEPITNPSQDMILGIYYLTKEKQGAKGEGKIYSSFSNLMRAYEYGHVELHARVALPYKKVKQEVHNTNRDKYYAISTVGKFILNQIFPDNFPFVFDNEVDNLLFNFAKSEAKYTVEPGTNIVEFIQNLPINEPLGKKHIAKLVSQVYYAYVPTLAMEDVVKVIKIVNSSNFHNTTLEYSKLDNYKGEKISHKEAKLLSKFTKEEFEKINRRILLENQNIERTFEAAERTELLEKVWFRYTNAVAEVLDKIKDLGFKYSTKSGITMSIFDIKLSPNKNKIIEEGEEYIEKLKKLFAHGLVTDDERYKLSIEKWAGLKQRVEKELDKVTSEEPDNPIFMMMKSGARGNISNFVQLAGMRGLMANNTQATKSDANNERIVRSIVEVPVKSSFLEGLTAYEFYSSTHGARKGLTDTALNTAISGYLTRRLVDVSQNIVVRNQDCGSDFGFIVKDIIDTKTGQIIVPLWERIEGRFTNVALHDENGELIVARNTLITPQLADLIIAKGFKEIEIRSILGCNTRNGVCKICYGKDLATNRLVSIGEAVGIIAAQSIGEPGTQLTMRTFHTGGVAGVEDITGGFTRLIELIDAHDNPWGKPAIISEWHGEVTEIEEKRDAEGNELNQSLVWIQTDTGQRKAVHVAGTRKYRVKPGDKVVPGQKIVEGPIILKELLKHADAYAVQNYLLKEIQRIYRMQGISISDKYIEIVIHQMLSKILISIPGDSDLFEGSIVDILEYQEINGKLLAQGKKPAFGSIVIKGAKQIPLLSDSFLAAASYQETSKILVHASISNQVDNLEGLKENIILGHKIPAGTNSNFEPKSKFDIKDPASFFEVEKTVTEEINEDLY